MNQLSTLFNQRKRKTFPNDTVQNSRNDSLCVDIATKSGKILTGLYLIISIPGDVVELEEEVDDKHLVQSKNLENIEDLSK